MGLEFNAEPRLPWATPDDRCGGRAAVLQIDTTAGSDTEGRLVVPNCMPGRR